jgi:hypothetical protein
MFSQELYTFLLSIILLSLVSVLKEHQNTKANTLKANKVVSPLRKSLPLKYID